MSLGTIRQRPVRRRWLLGITTAAMLAGIALFVASASGVLTGSPSNFEANDGNMIVNGGAGFHDWANVPFTHVTDSTTPADDSFTPGQKQDTACPDVTGHGNPPKDDFTDVVSFAETNATTHETYLYGATIRVAPNGTATENIELKQSNTLCPGQPAGGLTVRTPGDKMIAIDYSNGGATVTFNVLTWVASGPCFVSGDPNPCWGANVQPISSAGAEGLASQADIPAAQNPINGLFLKAGQFAEFGVNLATAGIIPAGTCKSFPQSVWESRSSTSFVSTTKDISIENKTISNCGEVIIKKRTDPRGVDQAFSFTSTLAGSELTCTQSTATSFSLNDSGNTSSDSAANTQDCTKVPAGSYTVNEPTVPGGFTFENLNCTADPTSGSTVTTSGRTATINLTPDGLVTCIYTNQKNTATLATQVSSAGPVFPGVAVHDTATVTGNIAADTPSGTVTFFLCGPIASGSCSSGGTNIGTGTLSGSGATASAASPDVNTSANSLAAGRYCFRAEWPGDTNYPAALTEFGGANGTNECFTVQTIPTSTVSTPSVGSGGTTAFGSQVTDHAVVTASQSGDGTPTGTVTFFVCNPSQTSGGACPAPNGTQVGSPVDTQAVSGSDPPASFADSSAVTVNQSGTWCFRAVYTPGGANGSNYTGSSDATSGECFTVSDTTSSTSAQNWLPNDTAAVAANHGAPLNGTLSAQLYTGDNCGATSGSAVSGQLYQKTLTNATSAADRTLTTNNTSFTVDTSQSVSWLVTFTSSDPNVTGSNHCESTALTITN